MSALPRNGTLSTSVNHTGRCQHESCQKRLHWANVTGFCLTHYNERRAANVRRCSQCGDKISASSKSGFCQWHMPRRIKFPKSCAHCDWPIDQKSRTGYCRAHCSPRSRIAPERLHEFDYLIRVKRMSAAEAEREIAKGPVVMPAYEAAPRAKPLLASEIIAFVAKELNTTPQVITSSSRYLPDVAARACVVHILRGRGLSYPAIGRRLGGRDHSTVISSERNYPKYAARFPRLNDVVAQFGGAA